MSTLLTLLISGGIVYLIFIIFERVFEAIGCGGQLVALVGFPIAILGLGYVAPGFLFTFTAAWGWQILWSILIASAVRYSSYMWRPKVRIVITRTQTFQKK